MSGLSRFDFYPRDWISGTRELSPKARGIYIDILARMYDLGRPLDYDEKDLCRFLSLHDRRQLIPILNELFDKGKLRRVGDKITNERFERELNKAHKKIEKGKMGGRPPLKENNNAPSKSHSQGVVKPLSTRIEGDGFKGKQAHSRNPPSPSPSNTTSKNNYAFAGKVIRLNEKDLTTWRNSYSAILDIRASLQSRDDWLATQPENDQRKWFVSTSVVLKKEHERALAEREHERESQHGSGAIY